MNTHATSPRQFAAQKTVLPIITTTFQDDDTRSQLIIEALIAAAERGGNFNLCRYVYLLGAKGIYLALTKASTCSMPTAPSSSSVASKHGILSLARAKQTSS